MLSRLSLPALHVVVTPIFSIMYNLSLVEEIKNGYENDEWCKRLRENITSAPDGAYRDGLLYQKDHLVIPRATKIPEQLFHLSHDSLGHFGMDKAYLVLHESFYWPNMRKDLEPSHIPSCDVCQQNKISTKRSPGPLHPLPVPDRRNDSVAIDFVSPLLEDEGYNYLVTITDRLNSDI